MKELSVPIDPAGRVVLPKPVRDELAIKPGDTLKVTVTGSAVMLTPTRERAGLVRRGKALVFTTKGEGSLSQEVVRDILDSSREKV